MAVAIGALGLLLSWSAIASAQTISIVSGNGQVICSLCPTKPSSFDPLVVIVKDARGNPAPSATVTWTISTPNSGDGHLGANTTTTGADGTSSNTAIVAAPLVLTYFSPQYIQATITATAFGSSVTFTETNGARDPNSGIALIVSNLLSPAPGTLLTGAAGSTGTDPIHITTQLLVGGPVPNVEVRVSSEDGLPGTAVCATAPNQAPNSVLTDATGSANCYLKFGNTPGQGRIRIYVGGTYDYYGPFVIQVQPGVVQTAHLSAAPAALSFQYPGGALSQTVAISSSGGPVNYTPSVSVGIAATTWLSVGAASGPATSTGQSTFTVSVAPQGLQNGPYYGIIVVHPDNGTPDLTINVTLTVGGVGGGTPRLSANPASLSFQYPGGPLSQTIGISSSAGSANYTALVSVGIAANTWLSVGTPSGPASTTGQSTFSVSVAPQTLLPGPYQGVILVHANNGAPDLTINIYLTVTAAPSNTLTLSPSTLYFSQVKGGASAPPQFTSVTSSGPTLQFTVGATGAAWLNISPSGGATPGQAVVAVDASSLQPGYYSVKVGFTAAGAANSPQSLIVNFTVGQPETLAISQTTPLAFTSQAGGPAPPAQAVAVAASALLPFTTTVAVSSPPGGSWLAVGPSSGTASATPTNLAVSVNPQGLIAGTYTGTVSVWSAGATNSPLSFTVIYTLQSAPVAVAKILPQFAFGGGWDSTLYLNNTTDTAVSFPVSFVGDDGQPLNVAAIGGSSTNVSLAAKGTAVIEAPDAGPLSQGYVLMMLPPGVTGYAVFRQSAAGRGDQEAVVPLSGAAATTSSLIWDDTNSVTAVAIVNPSDFDNTVTVVVRDPSGATIGTSTVTIPAKGKLAMALRDLPGMGAIPGNRGSAEFSVTSGNVAVLGLRFDAAAFTSIPTADR